MDLRLKKKNTPLPKQPPSSTPNLSLARKVCSSCGHVRPRQGTDSSPDLLFLAVSEEQGKPTKTARIRSRGRTPKILGKEAKNGQKNKDFLEKEKSEKSKTARKRRSGSMQNPGRAISTDFLFLSFLQWIRNTPSTAGNSMTSSERPSPEPILEKEASPAVRGGGENSGNALEASNALN